MKLHVGCGKSPRAGFVNIDITPLPGVDVVCDLEQKLPFEDNTFEEIYCSHVLEHIKNALGLMEELHRISKVGATAIFRVPYGSSDIAWEDPTHVRPYFLNSFDYFGQWIYRKADYGYKGDWVTKERHLRLDPDYKDVALKELAVLIKTGRNVVREMIVRLEAIKPIRPFGEGKDPLAVGKIEVSFEDK